MNEYETTPPAGIEQLQFTFPSALDDRCICAGPSPMEYETLKFDAKIKL